MEAGHRRARALAELLRDASITAIYTSQSQRTIQTALPLANALGIQPAALPREDTEGLVSRLRERHGQERVLIVAHWRTVPVLLKALGHPLDVKIGRQDYGNLFVVVPKAEGPPLVLRLRY